MRLTSTLSLALLSCSLVSASLHGLDAASPPHRRHLARTPIAGRYAPKIERADELLSNDTQDATSSSPAVSSDTSSTIASSAIASAATSSGSESGGVGDIIQPPSSTSSSSSTSSAASSVAVVESSAAPTSIAVETQIASSTAAVTSLVESSAAVVASSAIDNGPATISVSSASSLRTSAVRNVQSVVTATRTSSSVSSASAAADKSDSSSKGGLSTTAIVAIVVVASVVGLGALAVFAVRKWKLRPSNRFDKRMKPIDFSPHTDGMNDDFLEKTLQRSGSRSSADMQRQQFVKELETDPNYVAGVPDHDFTAVSNHAGYGSYAGDDYHNDPFAHAQSYEYDAGYYGNDAHGYPPAPAGQGQYADYPAQDHPTQDGPEEGYADLQRGNSTGSDHARQHQQVYPTDFPSPDNYLGRPTGGADGPYAQAAQYRGY